jgi:cytoskeletal protein RodZ
MEIKKLQNKRSLVVVTLVVAVLIPVSVAIYTLMRTTNNTAIISSSPVVISAVIDSSQATLPTNAQTTSTTSASTTTTNTSTTTTTIVSSATTTTAPSSTTTATSTTTSTTTQAPTVNTYTGKLYPFTINYALDWKVKSSSTNESVESLNLVPQGSQKISFRMSVNPDGTYISLPQGYLEVSTKQINVNGVNVTSKLYKPDPDIFDNMANSRYVRIDLNSGKEYIVESTFDTSSVGNGWDIINQIFTTLKF